jgi:hypothetical protein
VGWPGAQSCTTSRGEHCGGAARCVTRAFLASLEGSWRRAEVWMTETGAVYEGPDDAARARTQDCAGRFLQRLFAIDPRITRWYYYSFAGVGATGDSGACPFVSLDRGRVHNLLGARNARDLRHAPRPANRRAPRLPVAPRRLSLCTVRGRFVMLTGPRAAVSTPPR